MSTAISLSELDPSAKPARTLSGSHIQSVSRAVHLLMLVAGGTTNYTAKELAQAAGLRPPTAHHLLSTLVEEGILAKDSKARYLLGTKVAVLAEALHRAALPEYLLDPLRQLASTTGETSYVVAWRQGDIRVLGSVEGHQTVRVSLPTGPYKNAHARASGKLLLALAPDEVRHSYLAYPLQALTPHTITEPVKLGHEFETVRESGFCLDEEEFQSGVCCVAAPVMDEDVAIAAYSISVPSQRFYERRPWLIEAVRSIARTAGSRASGLSSSGRSQTVRGE